MIAIPPIQDSIASNLSRADLYSCSLVCHDWSAAFSPFLWRSLALGKVVLEDGPFLARLLDRYGHVVRALNIYYTTTIAKALFVKRQSLESIGHDKGGKFDCRIGHLERLVLRNSFSEGPPLRPLIHANRQTLRFLRLSIDTSDIPRVTKMLVLTSRLQKLEITCFGKPSVSHLISVLEMCPTLKHLVWEGGRFGDTSLPLATPGMDNSQDNHGLHCFALKSLHLRVFIPASGFGTPCSTAWLRALLQHRFPRLTTLELPEVADDALPLIREFLHPGLNPYITCLDFSSLGYHDWFVLQVINALPKNQLKRIKLRGTSECEATRSDVLDQIGRYQAKNLERLEFVSFTDYGDQWLCSDWIQMILATCTRLEVLRVETHEAEGPFLSAEDILKDDWVCKRLKYLQIMMCLECAHPELAYDPSLDPEQQCSHEYDPFQRHNVCAPWCPRGQAAYSWYCVGKIYKCDHYNMYEQHHLMCHLELQRVYAQLARLKDLEVLDVAVRVRQRSTRALCRVQLAMPWALATKGTRAMPAILHTSAAGLSDSPIPVLTTPTLRCEHFSGTVVATTKDTGQYLEALSVLKNLREFDFSGTQRCLRVAELRWMKEHWPQLERLAGLPPDPPSNAGEAEEEDEEQMSARKWCQKYWPKLKLEPSVFPRVVPWE